MNLTGSSCSGKSSLARAVAPRLPPTVVVADFDEIGVPDGADADWRLHATEQWIQRAIDLQARGRHLLLSGQTPLGELLACPSAVQIDGIANCLIDVQPNEQQHRLQARDPNKWSAQQINDFVAWARWHRRHAADPQHAQDVIVRDTPAPMTWHRWTRWTANDPRWDTSVIETTGKTIDECSAALASWLQTQITAWENESLPLRGDWWR